MNNKVKLMAAFAAGIGCGVLTTYKYFKNKYTKMAEEEFEAMRSLMEKRSEKESEKSTNNKDNDMFDTSSIVEMEKRLNELTDYSKIVDNYVSSVPPDENDIEKRIEKMQNLAESEHPREENDEQFEITSMDWLDDARYDKVILTYFVGDDTVANEVGHIDDIDMSIGMEQFELFKNSDDVERFIRNPRISIDYNIVKDLGCYHVE